jgi:exodeoxyribonuclease VII large subunit
MQPSAMSLPFPRHPVSQPSAVLTVSELNEIIRDRLETGLDAVWVAGELSNVRLPPSGHIYFTLKDQQSQISAVLFRRHAENLRFRMEDGMEVVCSGRVGLYTVRGALQFYAVEVEARGKGALAVAFEQLKKRLSQEGLFDVDRKKPLPFLPDHRHRHVASRRGRARHAEHHSRTVSRPPGGDPAGAGAG